MGTTIRDLRVCIFLVTLRTYYIESIHKNLKKITLIKKDFIKSFGTACYQHMIICFLAIENDVVNSGVLVTPFDNMTLCAGQIVLPQSPHVPMCVIKKGGALEKRVIRMFI